LFFGKEYHEARKKKKMDDIWKWIIIKLCIEYKLDTKGVEKYESAGERPIEWWSQ
jgi:hypothetical protein